MLLVVSIWGVLPCVVYLLQISQTQPYLCSSNCAKIARGMSFADVVILLGDAPYQIEPVVSDFPGAFNHQLGARIARWKNDLMNVDVMLNDKDKVTEAIWEVRGSGEINSVVPVSAVVID